MATVHGLRIFSTSHALCLCCRAPAAHQLHCFLAQVAGEEGEQAFDVVMVGHGSDIELIPLARLVACPDVRALAVSLPPSPLGPKELELLDIFARKVLAGTDTELGKRVSLLSSRRK